MKRKTIPIICLLLFFLPVMAFAVETLSTVYVDGSAPMTIDGILDDWESLDIQTVPVTNEIGDTSKNPRSVITTRGKADLSFSFKCFADARYVYVALMVTDDDIIIGKHDFGEGWKDDSTTICFDGDLQNISKSIFDANDGHIKVIGDTPDGVAYIEGNIANFYDVQVPYFWESRGIKAGFQQHDTGYIVEAAIPLKVLGWDKIELGKTLGMNFRVVDMDHNMNVNIFDKGLTWAPDPDHTSHYKTECYNRVIFSNEVSIQGEVDVQDSGGTLIRVGSEARELEIELSTPDYVSGIELFEEVLEDIAENNWADAESKIASVQDAIWAQSLLGVVQLKTEKIEKGVSQLLDLAEKCPDDFVEKWVKNLLIYNSKFLYNDIPGKDILNNHGNANISYILNEYLKTFPDDNLAIKRLLSMLKIIGNTEYDFSILNQIIQESNNLEISDNAKIALAKYYFYKGDNQSAETLANELIYSSAEAKTKLDARMIILSIEYKRKL